MHPDYMHIGAIDDCLIEEMAELTKELCKVKRFGMNNVSRERLAEEIADVQYRINQYRQMLEK